MAKCEACGFQHREYPEGCPYAWTHNGGAIMPTVEDAHPIHRLEDWPSPPGAAEIAELKAEIRELRQMILIAAGVLFVSLITLTVQPWQ